MRTTVLRGFHDAEPGEVHRDRCPLRGVRQGRWHDAHRARGAKGVPRRRRPSDGPGLARSAESFRRRRGPIEPAVPDLRRRWLRDRGIRGGHDVHRSDRGSRLDRRSEASLREPFSKGDRRSPGGIAIDPPRCARSVHARAQDPGGTHLPPHVRREVRRGGRLARARSCGEPDGPAGSTGQPSGPAGRHPPQAGRDGKLPGLPRPFELYPADRAGGRPPAAVGLTRGHPPFHGLSPPAPG